METLAELVDAERLRERFQAEGAWGLLGSVDIHGCRPGAIRDADTIRRFVAELCDRIDMRPYGPTQVVHFGEDEAVAGYSMTQLIETSLISGHFANRTNSAYLDIFSCKFYDPWDAAEFARAFFGGADYNLHIALRK